MSKSTPNPEPAMNTAPLTLTNIDALTLRHVLAQHINAMIALDEPKRGNSRLSENGKADLARMRAMLAEIDSIIVRLGEKIAS